jgi:multidrug resistance efflux pump
MTEEHHTETKKVEKKRDSRVLILAACILLIIGGGIGAVTYLSVSSKTVYIEDSQISAPLVDLSPTAGGTLKAVFVTEGETIPANTVVAQVDTELIKSTTGGLVVTVNNNIGKLVDPTTPVVVMIDPSQLRVVGQVQEDKGLVDIAVGDPVSFTVDAFGSRQFVGTVDSIAPTSENSDVVFSVSDKREEQNFDIKVKYDESAYPELKNGMSAKMWVFKE